MSNRISQPRASTLDEFLVIVILMSLVWKSVWSMSQPHCCAISLNLLTHVRNPWLWTLRNVVNTRLIIVFPGISANLQENVNTLMWDCMPGGTAPTSPSIISLLVLIWPIEYTKEILYWYHDLRLMPHPIHHYHGFVIVSKIYHWFE